MADPQGTLRYRRILTRERLVADFAAGLKPHDIAAEVGCAVNTVYLAARRHQISAGPGTSRGSRKTVWVDVLTAEYLQALYLDGGMTVAAVASEVGCAPTTVARALKRHGIPARPQARGGYHVYGDDAVDEADRSTGIRRRRSQGRPRPMNTPKSTDAELEDIARRAAAGETYAEVAASLGLTTRMVANRLHRWRHRAASTSERIA